MGNRQPDAFKPNDPAQVVEPGSAVSDVSDYLGPTLTAASIRLRTEGAQQTPERPSLTKALAN